MRRSASLSLTVLLGLATGVTLFGAALMMREPSQDTSAEDANAALVRRFYAAVNDVLQTGLTAALDELMADDFLDHVARPGLDASAAGLHQYLLSLRATFPGLRVT